MGGTAAPLADVESRAWESMKPLCIDLYCGLGGWAEGFLAEGYDVVGFDIERHDYGTGGYPGQLVLQDVLTLHGSQFRAATVIMASPPCQEFSYRAMPWKRARAQMPQVPPVWWSKMETQMTKTELAEWAEWRVEHPLPPPDLRLFEACFRIADEAGIPIVIENVKGAQPWVGDAKGNYGSFYLWGNIASVGGAIISEQPKFGELLRARRTGGKSNPDGTDHGQGSWFKVANSHNRGSKNDGGSWFAVAHNTESGHNQNPVNDGTKRPGRTLSEGFNNWPKDEQGNYIMPDGSKVGNGIKRPDGGSGSWFGSYAEQKERGTISPGRMHGSRSAARKAASAQIAKIPFALSRHIAQVYKSG